MSRGVVHGEAVDKAACGPTLWPTLLTKCVIFLCVLQGTLTEGSQISLMPTGQVSKVDSIYINEER